MCEKILDEIERKARAAILTPQDRFMFGKEPSNSWPGNCAKAKEIFEFHGSLSPDLILKMIAVIRAAPNNLCCDDFHHEKKDRHGAGDDCPPLKRYEQALKDLEQSF